MPPTSDAVRIDLLGGFRVRIGDPGAILDATWAHALATHAQGRAAARLREYLRATRHLPEIARAGGRRDEARDHLHRAAADVRAWGQPLDARRCAMLAEQ